MKYTMVDGNKDNTFSLYCYHNDTVVYEACYSTLEEAQHHAEKFLSGTLEVELA